MDFYTNRRVREPKAGFYRSQGVDLYRSKRIRVPTRGFLRSRRVKVSMCGVLLFRSRREKEPSFDRSRRMKVSTDGFLQEQDDLDSWV